MQFSKEMGGQQPPENGEEGEAMVRSLHKTQQTIDEKLNNTSFKLFENGADVSGSIEQIEELSADEGMQNLVRLETICIGMSFEYVGCCYDN